jgi:hypothetical protein
MTNECYDPNAADMADMMLDDVWYGEEDEGQRRGRDAEAGYVDEATQHSLLAWLYHETVRLMHRECVMHSSIDALVESQAGSRLASARPATTGHQHTAPHRVTRRRGRRAAAVAVPP